MNSLYNATYNPDVLSCIANLSNDEVFTPPSVANAMLDLLPQELFCNPGTKFLDPACKSGVFLREIAKRLIKGLEKKMPDLQKRLDHIFKNQLYGIAITELTSLLSRRSLYCSKYPNCKYSVTQFETAQGNIFFNSTSTKHRWVNGKCSFCGASREEYGDDKRKGLEKHAYQFIHNAIPGEIKNMKFDVIIGNPPYQLSDGGNAASSIPIYHLFVEQAKKLQPRYLLMIIPARWYTSGRGLDVFRNSMLNDKRIKYLIDYADSSECFPGVNIAGGVCYFLWDKDYSGDCIIGNITKGQENLIKRSLSEFQVFVRSNLAVNLIRKINLKATKSLSSIVLPSNPFGFRTYVRGQNKDFKGAVKIHTSEGIGYISSSEVTKNKVAISKYNIILTRAMSGGNKPGKDGKYQVVPSTMCIMCPNEICAETYICVGSFETKKEAQNVYLYLKTLFARFLMLQAMSSIMINRESFRFVPMQDFSKTWTDEELYKKYNLTKEEIAFIESMIRPME